MPKIEFDELPDHGRLWVFPASRDLGDTEVEALLSAVDEFLTQWSAHGAPLRSGRKLVERRFLLVGVDVDAEAPSGCSIDALVNRLRALGSELGLTLIDHGPVWFRTPGGGVRCVPRGEFRSLAEGGSVQPEGLVFDTSLSAIGEERSGGLERPATRTWHGKVFFSARQAAKATGG